MSHSVMKAVEIKEFGPAENLVLTERPVPSLAEGEVLVKVHAAGVNRPDLIQRQGFYPPPEGITDIPGLEVSGEVVETKSGEWTVGDRVCALVAGGGYAEYVAVPGGQCLPIPSGIDMIGAAALPEVAFTVWNNVFRIGKLKKGETILIHGGSSGIGTMAIQMAKAFGARVAVTAGSTQKCDACLALGADVAVNYKEDDFVSEIEAAFGAKAINIVLDMIGGSYVPRDMELMAYGARHVSIAFLGGRVAEVDIRKIMQNRFVFTGSTLRAQPIEEKTSIANELKEHIWPFIEAGVIKPVLYKEFPLSEASKAHETLEDSQHIGKVVLQVL